MFQTVGSAVYGRMVLLLAAVGCPGMILAGCGAPMTYRQVMRGSVTTSSVGLTPVVLTAALKSRVATPHALRAAEGLDRLVRSVPPAGWVGSRDRQTFTTAFALIALVEANREAKYADPIARMVRALRASQWNEAAGCDPSSRWYGGTGCHAESSPDLFHTSIAVEAMRQAGVPASDPYMRRARVFVSRCQNLRGPHNPFLEAGDPNDGGFANAPPRRYRAHPTGHPERNRRSCGSLTCAGLQSLIYTGLSKEDVRIKAAVNWLRGNYTLDGNPGMADSRRKLYEYYYAFAKAMTLVGQEVIVDPSGVEHHWRDELVEVLGRRQRPDGSWLNPAESDDPDEAHPLLTTSYAVMTLCQLGAGMPEGHASGAPFGEEAGLDHAK